MQIFQQIIAILASIGKRRGYDIWILGKETTGKDLYSQGRNCIEYMTLNVLKLTMPKIKVISYIEVQVLS